MCTKNTAELGGDLHFLLPVAALTIPTMPMDWTKHKGNACANLASVTPTATSSPPLLYICSQTGQQGNTEHGKKSLFRKHVAPRAPEPSSLPPPTHLGSTDPHPHLPSLFLLLWTQTYLSPQQLTKRSIYCLATLATPLHPQPSSSFSTSTHPLYLPDSYHSLRALWTPLRAPWPRPCSPQGTALPLFCYRCGGSCFWWRGSCCTQKGRGLSRGTCRTRRRGKPIGVSGQGAAGCFSRAGRWRFRGTAGMAKGTTVSEGIRQAGTK